MNGPFHEVGRLKCEQGGLLQPDQAPLALEHPAFSDPPCSQALYLSATAGASRGMPLFCCVRACAQQMSAAACAHPKMFANFDAAMRCRPPPLPRLQTSCWGAPTME